MEKKPSRWKAIAIAFIILFAISAGWNIWIIHTGNQIIEKENECIDVCFAYNDFDTYYFDYADYSCYCYEQDGTEHYKGKM